MGHGGGIRARPAAFFIVAVGLAAALAMILVDFLVGPC